MTPRLKSKAVIASLHYAILFIAVSISHYTRIYHHIISTKRRRRMRQPSSSGRGSLCIWRALLFVPLIGGAYNNDAAASCRIHRYHVGFLGGGPIVPRGISSRVFRSMGPAAPASPPVVNTMVIPLWRRGQSASTLLAEPEMEVTPVAVSRVSKAGRTCVDRMMMLMCVMMMPHSITGSATYSRK